MYRKKGLVIDSLVATSDPGRWLHRHTAPPRRVPGHGSFLNPVHMAMLVHKSRDLHLRHRR